MHRPLKLLSFATVTRFVFTAILLVPPQVLAATNSHTDPDRATLTLTAGVTAQDIKPLQPVRGIDLHRG